MRILKLALGVHVIALGALLSRAFAHGTAEEVADKWQRGISNSQQDMTAGVQRVTVAPGTAAAAKKQKFVSAMQDPATFDKWERGVRSVSLGSWQNSMVTLGIPRAAQGAQQKKDKMVNAMNSLLPFVDNLRNTVKSMPDNSQADREQRMLAWSRGMRQYRKPAAGA